MVSRKFQFTLLTLSASFAVVTLMVAASGAGNEKAVEAASSTETQIWTESAPPARDEGTSRDLPLSGNTVVLPSFADIVERANPAVVNITATEIIESGSRRSGRSGRFEFFFPDPRRSPDDRSDPEREDHGGSGFIISQDGYLLTNHHVVENADRITVRLLADSREYPAEVIGSDPDTDLALLKIRPNRNLPVIPLGDSSTLRVGDWVLAIGNPLAYEHTVTVGVVSAKGRKLWAMGRDPSLDDFIQTDAAINRGNSGGPLLNAQGEAVGINSAISVAGQGISFAIPVNMAKQVVSQLVNQGRVTRGALGVQIRDVARELDPDKREYFGLQNVRGAFVEHVTEDLPADRAGIRRGDTIVSVDGQRLVSSDDLIRKISAKAPGEKVTIGVLRNREEISFEVELVDRSDLDIRRASRSQSDQEEPPVGEKLDDTLGFAVHELNPAIRRQYGLEDEDEGVVVIFVGQTSPAWEKGLQEGDLILEVNRQRIRDLESFREATRDLKAGDLLNLYVQGQGTNLRYITLRVQE